MSQDSMSRGTRSWLTMLVLASMIVSAAAVQKKTARRYRRAVFILATTYSHRALRSTTIGAAVFHFRVRDGNGWGHRAKVTRSDPAPASPQAFDPLLTPSSPSTPSKPTRGPPDHAAAPTL